MLSGATAPSPCEENMGRGAGVLFNVTFDARTIDLSDRLPYVRKSDLGVKIGKKKFFTDSICFPVESVKMEAAESGAEIQSYKNAPIGYLLLNPEAISDALKDWIAEYGKGAKLKKIAIESVSQSRTMIYSAGWVRSAFPKDGVMGIEVDITIEFQANGRWDSTTVTSEETVYFDKNVDGFIRYESWMPAEYDAISVERAYNALDELWDENTEDDE
jgi:hypothetical protein